MAALAGAETGAAADGWAMAVVLEAAFLHATAAPGCSGYTLTSSGRANCGACGWRMSGRLRDVGTLHGARFALSALSRVGAAIALAISAVVAAMFEAVLPRFRPAI